MTQISKKKHSKIQTAIRSRFALHLANQVTPKLKYVLHLQHIAEHFD